MLAARRMREHAALFASVLGVTAILSGLGGGLVGYLTSALDDGVRATLAAASGPDGAFRVTLDIAEDPEDQDLRFEAVLSDLFGADGHFPLTAIRRESATQTIELSPADAASGSEPLAVSVMTIPDLEGHAELVDGSWPRDATGVTMQADAAALAGLGPGDAIVLGGGRFELTGTWRVTDGLAPRWFGDSTMSSGSDGGGTLGPVVVAHEGWDEICIGLSGSSGTCIGHDADWVLIPDPDRVGADDLRRISSGWAGIRSALEAEFGTFGRLDGGLDETVEGLGSRVDAVRAVTPVALLLVAAIGIVTLAELSRLLGAVRADELALLRSRGASARRIAVTTAVETATVSGAGALIGLAGGFAALSIVGADPRGTGIVGWFIAGGVAAIATGIAAGTSLVSARRALRRDTLNDPGRRADVVGAGLVALVTLAAGVSLWQFLLYGSPLTPAPGGGTQVDPVAVLAPALALVSIVLLALLAFPFLARYLAAAAARGTHLPAPLAARSVARRVQVAATPVVLVGLACGQLLLAATYAGTWQASYRQTIELRLGAPVSIEAPYGAFSDAALDRLRAVDGAGPLAPVLLGKGSFGGEPLSAVAATEGTLIGIAEDVGGLFDASAATAVTSAESPGPALPPSATDFEVTVTAEGFSEAPAVAAQLLDAYGALHRTELSFAGRFEAEGIAETWTFDGEIPGTADLGPWRILAFEVVLPATSDPGAISFRVDAVQAGDGDIELGMRWSVSTPGYDMSGLPSVIESEPGFRSSRGVDDGGIVRLVPLAPDRGLGLTVADVVISESLADAFGIVPGRLITLDLPFVDGDINATVGLVVPVIPGSEVGPAVLLDLAWVRALELRDTAVPAGAEQVWAAPSDPARVLAGFRDALPAGARLASIDDDPIGQMLRSASVVLVASAAGTALLALVAVATVSGALLRSRAGDVVLLRALGLSRRVQAKVRRGELAAIVAFGAVAGVIAGGLVSLLAVPPLARAAIPDPYPELATRLAADPTLLIAGFLSLALGIAAVLAVYGAAVATQARLLPAREELR